MLLMSLDVVAKQKDCWMSWLSY